jgi:diguanylate cyclase (GGDEF)-like protein
VQLTLRRLWESARDRDPAGAESRGARALGMNRILVLALLMAGVAAAGYLDHIQTEHWDLTLLYIWLVISSALLLPRRVAIAVALAAALVGAASISHPTSTSALIQAGSHAIIYWYVALVTSQLESERRKLLRLSRIDELTGLYNWRALHEQLRERIALAKRTQRPLAILMMDLDGFKKVNDRLGHAVGNQLLRDTASFLRATTRLGDGIFRFGGDEFVAILPDAGTPGADIVARRVHDSAGKLALGFPSEQIDVSLSIGIAAYPTDAEEADSLLRRADQALYEAKRAGGIAAAGGLKQDAA